MYERHCCTTLIAVAQTNGYFSRALLHNTDVTRRSLHRPQQDLLRLQASLSLQQRRPRHLWLVRFPFGVECKLETSYACLFWQLIFIHSFEKKAFVNVHWWEHPAMRGASYTYICAFDCGVNGRPRCCSSSAIPWKMGGCREFDHNLSWKGELLPIAKDPSVSFG